MKDHKEEKNETQDSKEVKKHQKIADNANDLTEIVFDLFFDKEFKGNTDPKEGMEGKDSNS